MALDKAADRGIDLVGGDTRPDHGPGQRPGLAVIRPGPAHGLDLSGGLSVRSTQAPSDP